MNRFLPPWLHRWTGLIWLALLLASVVLLGQRSQYGPTQYMQFTMDGLRAGTIYALIAMGFVTVFNVTGIINFAQGAFVMLGAMLTVTVNNSATFLPPAPRLLLAIVAGIVGTTLIGLLLERMTIYPARHASPLTLIIITVGDFIALQGLALIAWTAKPYTLPAFTTLQIADKTIRLAGVVLKAQSFWIWGTTALVLLVLGYFFERTMTGKALRACAINRLGARLMGISVSRMSLVAFGMAAALGAIGGIVVAPTTRPTYDMGLVLGLKGFVAAIMGGLVSYPGAVLGGLLLGILENLAAGVTKAGLKDMFAFLLLIIVLLYRPHGILAARQETVEARQP